MCRAHGRRCPNCASYAAAAKHNSRRRRNRQQQRAVVHELRNLGLTETAAALQQASPSVLEEFLTGTGLTVPALIDATLPHPTPNGPSAAGLIALAHDERARLAGAAITPAAQALAAAEQRVNDTTAAVASAHHAFETAGDAVDLAYAGVRGGTESREALAIARADLDAAAKDVQAAVQAQSEAHDDLDLANYRIAIEDLPGDARDAALAQLTPPQIDAIARAHVREVATAITATGPVTLRDRDPGISETGKIQFDTGYGIVRYDAQLLDGGTAIISRDFGEYDIVQNIGGQCHHDAGYGDTLAEALDRAARIPVFAGLEEPAAGASEIDHAAWKMKSQAALHVARLSADGTLATRADQQHGLDQALAEGADRLAGSLGPAVVRGEIYQAAKRHRQALRLQAAAEAGSQAHAAALAAGAPPAVAASDYHAAYNTALGTPTRGGATIPHFDHPAIPSSLGPEAHSALSRSGIRASGIESARDYSVIAARGGDLAAWGFTGPDNPTTVKTSDMAELTTTHEHFVNNVLDDHERTALRTYTGGDYMDINAAITGRDPSPSLQAKAVVAQIDSAFDRLAEHNNINTDPVTIIRGASVPSGWTGTPSEFLDAVYTPGSRTQTGKLTSASTDQKTALAFAQRRPCVIVMRTRHCLPVESITKSQGEHEAIVPPGVDMRCVRVDHHGIGGHPTVYLVAEDLVAEAQHHYDTHLGTP
ncbi:ADP-ribosyltransferase [Nocardia tengchongensis]|uniref:ADP-ribosyltransferase n=1 Tax=Nocardia tengchongensis TaxID=2055889 RepID=UPI00365DF642